MIKDNKLPIDNINYEVIKKVNVDNKHNEICELKDYANRTTKILKSDTLSEKSSYGINDFLNNEKINEDLENKDIPKYNDTVSKESINYAEGFGVTYNEVNQPESRSSASFNIDINKDIIKYMNSICKDSSTERVEQVQENEGEDYLNGASYKNNSDVSTASAGTGITRRILKEGHMKEINQNIGKDNNDQNNHTDVNVSNNQSANNINILSSFSIEDNSHRRSERNNQMEKDHQSVEIDMVITEKDKFFDTSNNRQNRSLKGEDNFNKNKDFTVDCSDTNNKHTPDDIKEDVEKHNPNLLEKTSLSEIFKNYTNYAIINALSSNLNSENCSEFFLTNSEVTKREQVVEEKVDKVKKVNKLEKLVKGHEVDLNKERNEPSKLIEYTCTNDHGAGVEASKQLIVENKDKEKILQLLQDNLGKNKLNNMNKNLLFLKRMQQYFYRKYINIKFPNDSNDYYYLLDLDWFNNLKDFLFKNSGTYPGSITNYKLYNTNKSEILNDVYMVNKENLKRNLKV